MTTGALILPRRLAIALLAEAQRAGKDAVSGVIAAHDGVPVSVQPGGADSAAVWARYRSGASEPDLAPGRQLLISIDLKGVLQLRCWENTAGTPAERELRIV
jgi:hypothetical protein